MSWRMLKKLFGCSTISAIVIVHSYAFVSPWLALRYFTQAFENQGTRKIEKLIDFLELREDIKVTAKAALIKSAAVELEGDPFAAMGIMMANAIVDPIIDQVISPAGLQLLFSAGEMSGGTDGLPENIDALARDLVSSGNGGEISRGRDVARSVEVKAEYVGINEIEVQVSNEDIFNESVSFYMRREGLGGWKISGVKIANSLIDKLMKY